MHIFGLSITYVKELIHLNLSIDFEKLQEFDNFIILWNKSFSFVSLWPLRQTSIAKTQEKLQDMVNSWLALEGSKAWKSTLTNHN